MKRTKTKVIAPPAQVTGAALEEWKRVIRELPNLTPADRTELAFYCQTYARWQEAEGRLSKEGTLIKTKSGAVVQHPSLSVSNTAAKLCHKFAIEFGLTPKARGERPQERRHRELEWE